jgi:voltage-gated potassium channel
MTVITLTTIGYREVHDMSPRGQIFTMLLALGGIFTLFYAASAIISEVVTGEVVAALGSRRMNRGLAELRNHLIVCGFDRMGRLVCQQLAAEAVPFVVIDRQAEALADFNLPRGIALVGDATSDELLIRAGVERARGLITVVASDSDNLFITISARLLNAKLFIVARADEERSCEKLKRAGASRVISPYVIGGARVAHAVLRPAVVDFLELATQTGHHDLNIEEALVAPSSALAGTSLEQGRLRQEHGVIVVAIKKATGRMHFNPPASSVIEAGDTLIMLGDRAALDCTAKVAGGPA